MAEVIVLVMTVRNSSRAVSVMVYVGVRRGHAICWMELTLGSTVSETVVVDSSMSKHEQALDKAEMTLSVSAVVVALA